MVGTSPDALRLAELYREIGHLVDLVEPGAGVRPGNSAAFVHVVDTGTLPLLELVRLVASDGGIAGIPFGPTGGPNEVGELVVDCEKRGVRLLLAYPPLCNQSFQLLRHYVETGLAGEVREITYSLPGGIAQFVSDIRSADSNQAGCRGLSQMAVLAGAQIRWSENGTSDDRILPDLTGVANVEGVPVTIRVHDSDSGDTTELIVHGDASNVGIRTDETGQSLWAQRGDHRRNLARYRDPDPLRDTVRTARRFLTGQTRNLPNGRSTLMLGNTFHKTRHFLGESPEDGRTTPEPSAPERSMGLNLDVYQKMPLQWGDNDAREPYWEAKFNIETVCNQDCIFCFARNGHMMLTNLDESPSLLGCLTGQGIRGVMFSGGEPTLNPNLADYIDDAKSSGIDFVTVESNAVLFKDVEEVARCRKAGLDAAFISFHSCHPETVQAITRLEDAYQMVLAGVQNLLRAGVEVHLNCVTNQYNYRELEELVRFVSRELPDVATMTLSFVAPLGRAFNRPDIVPRISEAAPFIREALLAAEEVGLSVSVPGRCGIPLCFLPELERFFVEYRLRNHVERKSNNLLGDRVKIDKCKNCPFDSCCQGLWRNYADLYGTDELRRCYSQVAEAR